MKKLRRIAFWGLLALLSLGLLEGALRVYARFAQPRNPTFRFAAPPLDEKITEADRNRYQQTDPQHPGNWVLIPGYRLTLGEILEQTRALETGQNGKTLLNYDARFLRGQQEKAEKLKTLMRQRGFSPRHCFLQINRWGFKGPEIAKAKTPGVPRIICLGDSCTFGGMEDFCYPRVLERTLRHSGIEAQVINAGVQGYGPGNVLLRLPYFLSFKPDLATLYIGWNAFPPSPGREPRSLPEHSLIYRTLRDFMHRIGPGAREAEAPNYYRAVKNFRYRPAFLPQLEEIVGRLKAHGVTPVLFTLPMLYSANYPPDPRTFSLAHPSHSGNLYLFAAQTRDYNRALRELAGRQQIPLIDLEKWGETALTPGIRYYSDSIHLNDLGNEKLGIYLAGELEKILPSRKPQTK